MALRMVSSSTPEPVTIMRNCGWVAFKLAIISNRFWLEFSPSRTRSMFCSVPASGNEAEISFRLQLEESLEAHEPQRVALNHGDTDERLVRQGSLHSFSIAALP